MNILDNPQEIKKIDRSGVHQSIENLDEQCWDAWQAVHKISIPQDYQHFTNVIVCGMGGSALGPHVIQRLFADQLSIPLVIVRDYHLPKFANQNSLVILSSYSGNTEETISCALEALKLGLKSFVIASGGKLQEIAAQNNLPYYLINPVYNPCGQPRMAIGYSIFGQLALFKLLALIQLNEEDVKATIQFIKEKQNKFSLEKPSSENDAKSLAQKIENKIIVLVAAQHLVGAVHVFNNQMNENGKHFSEIRSLPELNHHLMEGLTFPKSNPQNLHFVFIDSPFYSPRLRQRINLTQEVVNKNKVVTSTISISAAKNNLQEAFGLITFGAFVSFYTAMIHQIDPAPIPWVEYFKKSLEKSNNRLKNE